MDKNQLISTYRLISELFLYPEDRDAARIKAGKGWLEKAPTKIKTPIEAFFATPAAMSAEEYVATLELAPLVPLYLGSYLYEEPQSCRGAGLSGRNSYMLELANIYRHFGVEFAGREMADFVPVVVEFLGISLERGDQDRIGLRRYLVETLLIEGFESLLSALGKHESPYAHLVEALRFALIEDIAQMTGGPIWQPPADDGRSHADTAFCGLLATDRPALDNGVEL